MSGSVSHSKMQVAEWAPLVPGPGALGWVPIVFVSGSLLSGAPEGPWAGGSRPWLPSSEPSALSSGCLALLEDNRLNRES